MDSFNLHHDLKVQKSNAIAAYRQIRKIATLMRFVEVLLFLIIVSRLSSQFVFPLRTFVEHFRGIRFSITLISPRFVFLVVNAIVIVLFLRSGGFSGIDFYEEYAASCRKTQICDGYEQSIRRCQSQKVERIAKGETRRCLKRNVTERPRRKAAAAAAAEKMSNEEFRKVVEAFIERQQKSLREEEEL